MKLVYQYMAIFFNFKTTSNHLYPLQVDNCDSNSRLVVDKDENGKSRPERVNRHCLRFGAASISPSQQPTKSEKFNHFWSVIGQFSASQTGRLFNLD